MQLKAVALTQTQPLREVSQGDRVWFTVGLTAQAPAADVFAYVTDRTRATDYMGDVRAYTRLTPGPLRVGTQFGFRLNDAVDLVEEVTGFVPGQQYTSRVNYHSVELQNRIACSDFQGICLVTIEIVVHLNGLRAQTVGRLLLPKLRVQFQRDVAQLEKVLAEKFRS